LSGVAVTKDDWIHATGPLGQTAEKPENLEQVANQRSFLNALGSAYRGGVSKVARFTRTVGTLTPSKPWVNLEDPADFDTLRKALLYSLPVSAVDDLGRLYAAAGIDDRFRLAKGAIAQMLHSAGAFANGDDAQKILDMMQESYRNEAYAPLGIDKTADGIRHALLETQTSNRVHVPSLYEVHRASLADNFLQRMGMPEWVPGTKTASTILRGITGFGSRAMAVWRPMVLARLGFPLRIAIDENGNYALRNGVLPMIAARVALHSYKGDVKTLAKLRDAAAAAERGQDPEMTRWGRAAAMWAQRVPLPILRSVQSMKDLGTAVISENAWRVFKGTTGLSREDFYKAGDIVTTRWGVAGPAVSALAHAGGGIDEAEHLSNYLHDGAGKPIPLRWKKEGTYSEATRGDPLFLQKWGTALDIYGSSKLARAALETAGRHTDTQFRHVLSVLQSDDPDMVRLRSANDRNIRLPDGREVGIDDGVTQEAAQRAWARKIVAATNSLITGAGGTIHHDLIAEVLAKQGAPSMDTLKGPSMDTLKGIEDLPQSVFGPDLVPVSRFHDLLGRGMNKLAALMDILAREPNFLHATATNMKEVEPMVRALQGNGEHADALLGDLATQRAIADLKPFIHNPELKTSVRGAAPHGDAVPLRSAPVSPAMGSHLCRRARSDPHRSAVDDGTRDFGSDPQGHPGQLVLLLPRRRSSERRGGTRPRSLRIPDFDPRNYPVYRGGQVHRAGAGEPPHARCWTFPRHPAQVLCRHRARVPGHRAGHPSTGLPRPTGSRFFQACSVASSTESSGTRHLEPRTSQ
jgi:hypothetical protein